MEVIMSPLHLFPLIFKQFTVYGVNSESINAEQGEVTLSAPVVIESSDKNVLPVRRGLDVELLDNSIHWRTLETTAGGMGDETPSAFFNALSEISGEAAQKRFKSLSQQVIAELKRLQGEHQTCWSSNLFPFSLIDFSHSTELRGGACHLLIESRPR
jgi:hypothetical protein